MYSVMVSGTWRQVISACGFVFLQHLQLHCITVSDGTVGFHPQQQRKVIALAVV
jgi:hypothetical protein